MRTQFITIKIQTQCQTKNQTTARILKIRTQEQMVLILPTAQIRVIGVNNSTLIKPKSKVVPKGSNLNPHKIQEAQIYTRDGSITFKSFQHG